MTNQISRLWTVALDRPLHRKLKLLALEHDMSMKEFISSMIDKEWGTRDSTFARMTLKGKVQSNDNTKRKAS